MKRLTAVVIAFVMIFASLAMSAGCSDRSENKTLDVHIASEPNTIDPALNITVDGATLINHAFEGLTKIGSDGIVTMGVASDVKISEDGRTYTFTIRDDALWSDGQPVVAEDFVYSWRRLVDPATEASYAEMINMVEGVAQIIAPEDTNYVATREDIENIGIKALDSRTVEVKLINKCAYFLEVVAFPATFPVRRDIIEKYGDDWTLSPDTYIGNGSYKLKEWQHSNYLLYTKNPNYYDYDKLGPANIKFHLMEDVNAILAAYKANSIVFADELPLDEIQTLKESGELKLINLLGTYYVCFNNKVPPFDNEKVREAFSLAIDRDFICDKVTKAGEEPADAFVPPGLHDADPSKSFRDVGKSYYSVDPADYDKNVEKARALLAEAGYPEGRGLPEIEYLYNTSDNHKSIAEALQNMWRVKLGVRVKLRELPWDQFLATREDGDYTVVRHGWACDYNDPISFLDYWASYSANNDARYGNPAYDAKLQSSYDAKTAEERFAALHEAEDILMGDYANAPIFYYTDLYLIKPNVKGFYSTPLGFKYFMYVTVE